MKGTALLMLAGALLMAACAPSVVAPSATDTPIPVTTEPPVEMDEPTATATATATEEHQDPMSPMGGEELLQDRCTACHTLDRVESASKSAEQWEATVNRMIGHGAVLTAEEIDALVQYLAQTYP